MTAVAMHAQEVHQRAEKQQEEHEDLASADAQGGQIEERQSHKGRADPEPPPVHAELLPPFGLEDQRLIHAVTSGMEMIMERRKT